MKVARLTEGCLQNKKGHFKSVHYRTKFSQNLYDQEDLFIIRSYDSWLVRLLKRKKSVIQSKSEEYQSVKYNNIWVPFTVIDYILVQYLKFIPIVKIIFLNIHIPKFKKYDVVITHSSETGRLALKLNSRYRIPFVSFFHGSDIHTIPFNNNNNFRLVKRILQISSSSIFVSNKLMEDSKKINSSADIKRFVIYNGVSSDFYKYSSECRKDLRRRFNPESKKIVAFVGNLVPVKNINILPVMFESIKNKYNGAIEFWIVGSGNLLYKLKIDSAAKNLDVKYFGSVDPSEMPDIMNMIDLLVIPSVNEGLPNVALEAIMSGVMVIGSDVGGISEAIGKENTFILDDDFVELISAKASRLLINPSSYISSFEKNNFSWIKASESEFGIISKIVMNIN